MDKETNTSNSGNATEQSREEKIASMKAAISENFKYLAFSEKFDEAMGKLARYAVEMKKDADKVGKEFKNYKVESIILKVDSYDNQKVADDVLSPWKWQHPKGDVALIVQHIGRLTAANGENPRDVAEKYLDMGFEQAFAMTKPEQEKRKQASYDPKVEAAIAKKAELAKEVAEYMWPGSGDSFKSDINKFKFCSTVARESFESNIHFKTLVVDYFGMMPELAWNSLNEYVKKRGEAGDRRTDLQKFQADQAAKYTKELNNGLWVGVKGESAQKKSSFVGKVSWHCVFNDKKPAEFIAKYKDMSPEKALESYIAGFEKKPVEEVKQRTPEEIEQMKEDWKSRAEKAVAILCPDPKTVTPALTQLAQALATDSMESKVPVEKLAGKYAAKKMDPEEMFKAYRQSKAESVSRGNQVGEPALAEKKPAEAQKRVISR